MGATVVPPAVRPRKILVVRTDHLGDLVLTTPLLRALAAGGHAVDVMACGAFLPVLSGNPHVVRSVAIEEVCPAFPKGWRALARWLRLQNYETLVLPHARPRELLWAALASGVGRRIAMWSGIWGRLTGCRCLRSNLRGRPRHISDVYLDCARALSVEPAGLAPEIFPSEEARRWAAEALKRRFGDRPVVGIHPGCKGNTCNLPAAEYGRLAELVLRRPDLAVVVTGTPDERDLLTAWPAAVRESDRLWDAMGEVSLERLPALLERMAVFVCVGTGPLHVASAMRVRTVSPFCAWPPLSAAVWGSLGGPAATVHAPGEHCRQHRAHFTGHCDFAGTVTAEMLMREISTFLPSGAARA